MDAFGDEMEGGATGHGDCGAGVVSQNKDVRVIWRVFAPPTFPLFVGPGAAEGTEHVAAEDVGSDILEAAGRVVVVDSGGAAFAAVHLLKGASGEEPLEDFFSADA